MPRRLIRGSASKAVADLALFAAESPFRVRHSYSSNIADSIASPGTISNRILVSFIAGTIGLTGRPEGGPRASRYRHEAATRHGHLDGVLVLFLGIVLAYKYVLAVVGLVGSEEARQASWPPVHRFAIVIPAHDEEASIREAVESCRLSNYPGERFAVFVIADNCSDQTAERALLAGAVCWNGSDPTARGKGHALAWGFDQVLPMGFDALVVLDADCRIEPHALRAFDRALEAGERVLQCSYVVANPDEAAMSYASAVGNAIENDLFYEPKSRLGLAVLLRGTGMVFHREILERFPWKAHSVTEDVQYALQLIRDGVRIRFLPDVRGLLPFPVTPEPLAIQRRRWAAGVAGLGKVEAMRLMIDGCGSATLGSSTRGGRSWS